MKAPVMERVRKRSGGSEGEEKQTAGRTCVKIKVKVVFNLSEISVIAKAANPIVVSKKTGSPTL